MILMETNEMNPLQDKLESTIITKTFKVSGMPIKVFEEVDEFCKLSFGDSRWTMIHSLVKGAKEDYKYMMLYDRIQDLETEIEALKAKPKDIEKKVLKTFGKRKENEEQTD